LGSVLVYKAMKGGRCDDVSTGIGFSGHAVGGSGGGLCLVVNWGGV